MAGTDDTQYLIGLEAVRLAFCHKSKPGRSALAGLGGEHLKPRQARHGRSAATQVYAVESTQPQFSRPVLPEVQQLTGWIHREIAKLEALEVLWVQYRYRLPGAAKAKHAEEFTRAYASLYELENMSGSKAATRGTVRDLIGVAVVRAAVPGVSINPAGRRFSARNWNKTYKPHWERITGDLADLDRSALIKIGQAISER